MKKFIYRTFLIFVVTITTSSICTTASAQQRSCAVQMPSGDTSLQDKLSNYISNGNFEQVQELIEKEGAPVNKDDQNGFAPLANASAYANSNMVDYLLVKGANVNHCSGDPALAWAITHARLDNVKLLVAKGADINMLNQDGHSPLQIAEKHKCTAQQTQSDILTCKNRENIIEFLKEKGAT